MTRTGVLRASTVDWVGRVWQSLWVDGEALLVKNARVHQRSVRAARTARRFQRIFGGLQFPTMARPTERQSKICHLPRLFFTWSLGRDDFRVHLSLGGRVRAFNVSCAPEKLTALLTQTRSLQNDNAKSCSSRALSDATASTSI